MGGAGAVCADVGVADLLAAEALCSGLPQSTPAGHAGGLGLAPVTYQANSRMTKGSFAIADGGPLNHPRVPTNYFEWANPEALESI